MDGVAPARRRWKKANLPAVTAAMLTLGVGVASGATGGGIGPDDPAPTGTGTGGGGATTSDGVFPVRGKHSYGDGFGAGRNHKGQDVMAHCGTKLVAAQGGRIQVNKSHSAAGNYIVVDIAGSRIDHVYAHLRRRAVLRKGQTVATGETIGKVGDSGNATACHLHFELWSRPGYYEGGRAMTSVTRQLKAWDRTS
jgi:murein DD-endopeptidase MepM/ murein hydrolase activator NlpD